MQIQSVKELIFSLKSTIESQFRIIHVQGEVSNLSRSAAGHIYFSLSDADALISAVFFRMEAIRSPFSRSLKDGDKIICSGQIAVYEKRGSLQIIVKKIALQGEGALKQRFLALKQKLSAEGLFDLEDKRPLPLYPKRVAVITALGGAALQDFLNVYRRRSLWMEIVVVPALVQGEQSAASLRQAVENVFQQHQKSAFDVLVLTRGGGSLEDLWSFNDEQLARLLSQSPIPTLSAVGHQVDFSICDFVCDVRAETPTAAAQLLTEAQIKMIEVLKRTRQSLLSSTKHHLMEQKARLEQVHPQVLLQEISDHVLQLSRRLEKCRIHDRIIQLSGLYPKYMQLDECLRRLDTVVNRTIHDQVNRLDRCEALLKGLGPQNVLSRGYTYVTDEKGGLVTTLGRHRQLSDGEKIKIQFSDGVGNALKSHS